MDMRQTCRRAAALLAVASGALAITASAQAGPGHTHTAPHGGDVVETERHHVEFKADSSGNVSVWLLDANEKTLAPPAGASVSLVPDEGPQVTLPLTPETATRRLAARFDPKAFPAFEAIVSLPIGGNRRTFRFHYPAHH